MSKDRLQDAYEEWGEEWKPRHGENHPTTYDAFEAGWMSAIEIMLERLEMAKT